MIQVSKIKRNVKRSALYHLLQTISHNNINAKVDAWGGAIVIGIAVSGVYLMRTLLSAAQ
jgi:uncharacterized membrane protein SpoIIM required for sporulation